MQSGHQPSPGSTFDTAQWVARYESNSRSTDGTCLKTTEKLTQEIRDHASVSILFELEDNNFYDDSIFSVLLSAGVSINSQHPVTGDTLLHRLVRDSFHTTENNRWTMIEWILSTKNPDITLKNAQGKTFIQLAADNKWNHVILDCLKRKMTDAEDKAGFGYAVSCAIKNGTYWQVENLFNAGIPKNTKQPEEKKPEDGDNYLHQAVRSVNNESAASACTRTIVTLLSFDPGYKIFSAENKAGETPEQLANKLRGLRFTTYAKAYDTYLKGEALKSVILLTVFAQARRQQQKPKCFMRKTPDIILEGLLPWLTDINRILLKKNNPPIQDTIATRMQFLEKNNGNDEARNAATEFLADIERSVTRKYTCSKDTDTLIASYKTALAKSGRAVEAINDATKHYMAAIQNRETTSRGLLQKHGLMKLANKTFPDFNDFPTSPDGFWKRVLFR
ncbi:MAG TPA: hypothetical protein VLJ15_00385 [Gammaproteobacteria bacterium]|nr:hypothetical protein [Gammaproteobacteria bacterium]